MADTTINGLTATTSAVAADEIPIWVAGSAVTRKITRANFLSGYAAVSGGAWTPVLRFGGATTGITYSQNLAYYRKVGDLVFIVADIRLSSKGSATGTADIGGLPFSSSANQVNGPIDVRWVQMTTALVHVAGVVAASSAVMALYGLAAAGVSLGTVTEAAFANNSILQIAGCYIAA